MPKLVGVPARGVYRTGDYWLIPARIASGDVLWSQHENQQHEQEPAFIAPDGIPRHRTAIGHGTKTTTGWTLSDAGRTLDPAGK